MFLDQLISCFFTEYTGISSSENHEYFIYELEAPNINESVGDTPIDLNFLTSRDTLLIVVTFGDNDPIQFTSRDAISDFIDSFKNEAKFSDDKITCSLRINKTVQDHSISVYDIEIFERTLANLSHYQVLTVFNNLLEGKDNICFRVLGLTTNIRTETISLTPIDDTAEFSVDIDRLKRWEKIKTLSYYSNIDQHKLIPDDFHFVVNDNSLKALTKLFNTLCVSLSVIYLFDITSIDDDTFEYKLNGYKSITNSFSLKKEQIWQEEYYQIYEWVYNGGNINDKIGLARNIISLHLNKVDKISLKGNPFESIQSSYKVYEKQNIKQYVEIRNKISDQLLDFNNRANKVIETFASGFQKSSLALITFYSSAIIIRVLGKGEFTNIFTLDATILSLAFIIVSFVYFYYSRWEVKMQRKRFIDSYNNLKERYTDLLEENDISRILNDDKEFNADVKFINDKLKVYSIQWILFLFLLFFVTTLLFLIYNISAIKNSFIIHLLFDTKCNC